MTKRITLQITSIYSRQCRSLIWQWFACRQCIAFTFGYRGKQIHIAVLSFTMVWFGLLVPHFLQMMFVICGLWMRRRGTRSSYGTGQNVCLRLNYSFMAYLLHLASKLYKSQKKRSYLKDCSSHDMYNLLLTSTDELLALSRVSYIGMKAFQTIVFAVVASVEYCCTALVKKSNKTLHFYTKLSCAFRIYTARWL